MIDRIIKRAAARGIGIAISGLLLAGVATLASRPAQAALPYAADYGVYMGASAGALMYNEDGLAQMSPTIGVFHIGQQFNRYLGIEGRIGTSVSGGSTDGYHINAQAVYGGYLRGTYPFTPYISGYAVAGLGGAQWHRNYPAHDSNDVGLSFGVGAELNLGGNAAIDVEWLRLTHGNNVGYDYSADALTFGVTWRIR